MKILKTLLVFVLLSFFPVNTYPSIIVVYIESDRIIMISDSQEVSVEKGKDIETNDSICKIRIYNNYAIAFLGAAEGTKPIKYNAWKTAQKSFNKYAYKDAINNLTMELEIVLRKVGDEFRKTNESYQNARPDNGPIILSALIVGKEKDVFRLQVIDFGYTLNGGVSKIKVLGRSILPEQGIIKNYYDGVQLDNAQIKFIENHVDLNNVETMNKLIRMISETDSRFVGGEINILEVRKDGFKWLQNKSCN